MKFGDNVTIGDGSLLEGCAGIIYRLEEGKALVLPAKEVLWPVAQSQLELAGESD